MSPYTIVFLSIRSRRSTTIILDHVIRQNTVVHGRNYPLYIGVYRSFYDFDRFENVDVLKSLLEENHFKWEDIRIIIKMLKENRLSTEA